MIKVIGVKVGGVPKEFDMEDGVQTLGDLRKLIGAADMQASINGDAEDDESCELDDFNFVSFAAKVKGASLN